MIKRINLWSGPRNISTATMYAFAQRNDTTVVDEPLYAHYLSKTNAAQYHPGADEVLANQENDGSKVIATMLGSYSTPVVFFKHMAHHLVELDWGFMADCTNVILTRDPRDMLRSFVRQIDAPTLKDVGYQQQVQILNYLNENNLPVVVLESKQVLMDPQKVLSKLCAAVDLPFDEKMLGWEAGARPEDGIWAKYWYKSVHQSTGFAPYQPKTAVFPAYLEPLYEICMPYYEQLKALAIRTD